MIKLLPIFAFFLLACTTKEKEKTVETPIRIEKPAFKNILEAAKLKGAILILDAAAETFYSNDFTWCETGKLPASTFKIPNSMIALETGVVKDDSTLFEWDGEPRALEVWEADLIFKQAFHRSCVPCYQEVARKVGLERMRAHITKFDYGNIIVDSASLDNFWLVGDSKITAFEQINFLQRFYESKLPITERTERIMREMIVIENKTTYSLSGKTGWSIRGDHNNGWFVGYVERDKKVYYFATNVEPEVDFDMSQFPTARKKVTYQALEEMEIIN